MENILHILPFYHSNSIPQVFIAYLLHVKVKVTQSCLTPYNPMDYTVHRILQARMLEWVAFPFSRGSSQPRDWTQVSHITGRFFTSWARRETLWQLRKDKEHYQIISLGIILFFSCYTINKVSLVRIFPFSWWENWVRRVFLLKLSKDTVAGPRAAFRVPLQCAAWGSVDEKMENKTEED